MFDDANLASALARGYAHALDEACLASPDGARLTYREVEARADAFAGVLRVHGAEPGDRVVTKVQKSPDAVALYLACLRLGAVFVPLNPAFTPTEQAFYLEDAEPAVFVNEPGDPPDPTAPTLTLGIDSTGTLADHARTTEPLDGIVRRGPDDLAAMLYTSGTTGRPKGAMLTHAGLVANGQALHDAWGFGPDDRLIHPLPIFHAHGLFVALHCIMLSGGQTMLLPRFSVDHVIDALPSATVMMAVPTIYTRLLADPRFDAGRCDGIRLLTSGSAPMTAAVHEQVTARTGHHILERYGMTEAGMITTNPLDGERVPGTVGFALPGYELRVTGPGGACPTGVPGVVEIRGSHLFAGYWKLPDKTAEAYRDDGYFVTGDVGSLDEDGRLTLQGRSSDMIISGGENVYPKEIELCLDEAPGVVESAVVGLPDDDLGETVVAFVVATDGYDEDVVRARIEGHLAPFKRPRRYEVVDELPRNAMGKVQKSLLRGR